MVCVVLGFVTWTCGHVLGGSLGVYAIGAGEARCWPWILPYSGMLDFDTGFVLIVELLFYSVNVVLGSLTAEEAIQGYGGSDGHTPFRLPCSCRGFQWLSS